MHTTHNSLPVPDASQIPSQRNQARKIIMYQQHLKVVEVRYQFSKFTMSSDFVLA
jgi:hypothetical protein